MQPKPRQDKAISCPEASAAESVAAAAWRARPLRGGRNSQVDIWRARAHHS